MNSNIAVQQGTRRTSADDVFDQLHADIVSLRLLPGTKLSESDIAKQNQVSRQPVREAFIRLSNMRLLEVRPQKATLVRKISVTEILNSRFIRTAVEIEVIRKACSRMDDINDNAFELNLAQQLQAAKNNDPDAFHVLDYEFHLQICIAADVKFAFDTISENKSHVDRLCMLCLANEQAMIELIDDHTQIFNALKTRDVRSMIDMTRFHLSRLDNTLKVARKEHGELFAA
jgi:DNA-binding GntR family transcriptional regulator